MEAQKMESYILAIDIGASSGRHILGTLHEGRWALGEVYRFPNGMVEKDGHLCWDVDALLAHLIAGLKECKKLGKIPYQY